MIHQTRPRQLLAPPGPGRIWRRRPARATERRPRGDRWTAALLLIPALLALGVVVVYPIVTIAVESLFDVNPLRHEGWRFTGLDNFAELAGDTDLRSSMWNSLVWTVGSVAGQFALALPAALLLRGAFRGHVAVRLLMLLPWAVPGIVGALAWKWVYHPQYGVVNASLDGLGLHELSRAWLSEPGSALWAVVVANIWRGFPFLMVLLLAGMAAIPGQTYEAAAVDGAGAWQRLRYVTLPLLRPVILLGTLLSGIWTFNNFGTIYILTGGGPAGRTDILVTFIYANAFERLDFGYSAAMSVVLFAIVATVAAVYIRMLGREALQ